MVSAPLVYQPQIGLFDELFEALDKARRRGAVYQAVIKGETEEHHDVIEDVLAVIGTNPDIQTKHYHNESSFFTI